MLHRSLPFLGSYVGTYVHTSSLHFIHSFSNRRRSSVRTFRLLLLLLRTCSIMPCSAIFDIRTLVCLASFAADLCNIEPDPDMAVVLWSPHPSLPNSTCMLCTAQWNFSNVAVDLAVWRDQCHCSYAHMLVPGCLEPSPAPPAQHQFMRTMVVWFLVGNVITAIVTVLATLLLPKAVQRFCYSSSLHLHFF